MDAEHRFILMLTLTAVILLTVLGLVLLFVLWPYHLIIGWTLIGLVTLVLLVAVGVTANEQVLRHKRIKYHSEMPLDKSGRPLYLYGDMKPYPKEETRYD